MVNIVFLLLFVCFSLFFFFFHFHFFMYNSSLLEADKTRYQFEQFISVKGEPHMYEIDYLPIIWGILCNQSSYKSTVIFSLKGAPHLERGRIFNPHSLEKWKNFPRSRISIFTVYKAENLTPYIKMCQLEIIHSSRTRLNPINRASKLTDKLVARHRSNPCFDSKFYRILAVKDVEHITLTSTC